MPPIVEEPEEEIVLVNTEFVWAEGAFKDVKLCGAWNGWIPQQMFYEGGEWRIVWKFCGRKERENVFGEM